MKTGKQLTPGAGLLIFALAILVCAVWSGLLVLSGEYAVDSIAGVIHPPGAVRSGFVVSVPVDADPFAAPPGTLPLTVVASDSATSTAVSDSIPVSTQNVTAAASATVTPLPTASASPTVTSSPTITPSPTVTKTPTRKPTPTRTATPTPYPVPTGSITRIDTRFHSAALQQDREIIIYLPPGYDTQTKRRYPVLYLLHGYGGFNLQNTTEWEQAGLLNQAQALMVSGKIQPMIIVQPNGYMDGGQPSLFFNHGPGTDGKRWGDYIWQDLVTYMDVTYRTLARRESRAVGGISFGGQGALSLGLTHPEVFKVVGANSPSFRGADGSLPIINDWNWFNKFDPIWLVQNTSNARQLTLWLDVAANDNAVRNCGQGSDRCVEAFHNLLVSKGIPHEWHDNWPGTHDWGTYWGAHISDYLQWYSAKLAAQ